MNALFDNNRVRQIGGGICLIAAPVALFAGTAVHPGLSSDASGLLRIVARHRDAWYATHILGWAFVVLAIPAILALAHLLRDRQGVFGNLGAALAVIGIIGFAGVVTAYGFVAWQMVVAGDRAQMVALFARLEHSPGVWIPLRAMTAALVPGFGLLAIGLVRARAVPLWTPPTFALGIVLVGLGMAKANTEVILVGSALMTLGLGWIGVLVLRQPVQAWQDSASLVARSQAQGLIGDQSESEPG